MSKVADKAALFLKGMAIGAVDVIPGVSGGTIAVILGVYEELTSNIANFISNLKNKAKRAEMLGFLLPILAGDLTSIVIFSKIIAVLLTHEPQATQLFFVGLILGSLPLIFVYTRENKWGVNHLVGLLVGSIFMATFVYFSKGVSGDEGQHISVALGHMPTISLPYLIKLFACGAIAASFMIVPGVSGSMMLVLIGEYYTLLGFINNFIDALRSFDISTMLPIGTCLAFFGVGIIVGIAYTSKLITWALNRYRDFTFSAIFGLLLFSVWAIWPGFDIEDLAWLKNSLALLVGFAIAMIFAFKK